MSDSRKRRFIMKNTIKNNQKKDTYCPKIDNRHDRGYVDWLENMVIMLCRDYMEIIRVLREVNNKDIIEKIPLPVRDETRRAIRLISEQAQTSRKTVPEKDVEKFKDWLIINHSDNAVSKITGDTYDKKMETK